ncbi:hypothetical protein H0H92_001399 [Tricholoma furcatifolium]|nr:hypothetical protein H0H92_001399 [Tricholoma furcatifolium]
MPSVRKSSIGAARRQTQKAHIPYRGDNPEVGKKTGVAVRHVERKSDGFEPFDELMEQADERTPPVLKVAKKKKHSLPTPQEDDDEYGEMSMDIESPAKYFSNSRQPITPTVNRNGSSRSVARTSDIDFDHIPSPRRQSSSHHRSTPGPSRLSNSFRAGDDDDDSDGDGNEPAYDYGGDFDAQPSGEHHSPEATSFMEMDQDDDEEQSHHTPEPMLTSSPDKSRKGKGRAALSDVPEERESDVEDDIAQGLEDVGEQMYSDEEAPMEEDLEPEPAPKRAKTIKIAEDSLKPPRERKARVKKENLPRREGVRKSAREHIKPLEYWRGERKVYGRPDGANFILVPHVKEIIRVPKEEPEPLQKRKRSGRARSKTVEEVRYEVIPVENPEDGWDDKTDPFCTVLQYGTAEEVERCVASLGRDLAPTRSTGSGDWRFKKALGDADFIASGILELPPKGKKPSKQTKDNTYIFYIIQGAVNVKIHNTSLILATGASFIVPRGNSYFIENISERDTRLFFTQARKVVEDYPTPLAPPRRSSVGASTQTQPQPLARSTSVAGVVTDTREMSKAPAPKRATSRAY